MGRGEGPSLDLQTPSESVLPNSLGDDRTNTAHLVIDTTPDTIARPTDDAYRIEDPSSHVVEIDKDLIGRFLIKAGYGLS